MIADPVIQHLERIREEVEAERGPFELFALFRRPDSPSEWDLVVAAPWLRDLKPNGIEYLAGLVYSDALPRTDWWRIARIVTLDESDASFKELKGLFGKTDGLKIFEHPRVSGLDLEEAYVLRST